MGWEAELWETEFAGHEVELAAQAQDAGWPVVVAIGGDGTVHGVVNGLLRAGPTETLFGHVPIGTGSDFAKTVGLDKSRHPDRNLTSVLGGGVRELDLGKALGEYFVNSFGIGFSAEVARNVLKFKRLRGFPRYFASVLRTFRTFTMPHLDVMASEHRQEGRIMMAEIAIGKTTGGGFKLTPNADPCDGLLDVCLIGEVSLSYFLRHVHHVMKGTHTHLEPVNVFQTDKVTVGSSAGSFPVHLDGELRYAESADIEIEIDAAGLKALCAR
jgi:YegS/Rv2252/BmrU family lipid kinase